jgi:hypothetical protein
MRHFKIDIQNVASLDDGIWTIGKLFDSEDFEYIKQSVLACPQDLYTPSPAHPTDRFELTWQLDGILEELWNAFDSCTPAISQIAGVPLKFGQVRVWQDHPGFMIPFHEDDQVSAAHIQLYIDGPGNDIGTTWYTTKGRHSCPFEPNSGYLTLCDRRLPHGMLTPVSGRIRYSLYATFAKAG